MSTTSLPPVPLIAAVHGLKSVSPRRRIAVKITPYELRVAPAGRPHGTRRYGRDAAEAVVTIATTTSGSGPPRWMSRAAERINAGLAESLGEARAIVAEVYAHRRRRASWAVGSTATAGGADGAAHLIADPGWDAATPISPEATLRAAGIDDARQAAYQRKMSALLAGRAG